jgi:hypothetical protein
MKKRRRRRRRRKSKVLVLQGSCKGQPKDVLNRYIKMRKFT